MIMIREIYKLEQFRFLFLWLFSSESCFMEMDFCVCLSSQEQ